MRNRCLRLLVLVPHRDARLPLRAWSASLFSSGLPGAWSFPWVAPLAALNRPLSSGELKRLAFALRREINLAGGKFICGQPTLASISADLGGEAVSVFGPALNIGLSDSFFDFEDNPIVRRISPLVIGAALCQTPSPSVTGCPPPGVSFRAAALANMDFRPLPLQDGAHNDFSFEWEIEKLHWLPAPKKNVRELQP